MHLLLGDSHDACCLALRSMLEAGGFPTHIISNPLLLPVRFSWRLNTERTASKLAWEEQPHLPDDQIRGVFVGSSGWFDPTGWQPDDLAYMQAEVQAALLAWLWSLDCPVVNRYPPAIWYQPQAPFLAWQRIIRQSGLPAPEILVTNVESEARSFRQRLARKGVNGAVYGALTSEARYLLSSDEDWNGLSAIQRYTPVSLTVPHGAAQLVCIVGEQVIWNDQPSPEMLLLEPALRRFSVTAGLAYVELAFASGSEGLRVIAVEPHPHFETYHEKARQQILEGLVHLLTRETSFERKPLVSSSKRSLP